MYIEKRFVQTQRLDKRREGKEDRANLATDLGIVLHSHGNEYALRTEPSRRGDRHGAVDTELASFVRCGADDTAALDAAYDHGLAAQLGAITLFDGRVEGVHVHMKDGSWNH